MELLADYHEQYIVCQADPSYTRKIESMAQELLAVFNCHGNCPDEKCLQLSRDFLIKIEEWKQMRCEARTGLAARNAPKTVWDSLLPAAQADSDMGAFKAVMKLTGFGSTVDPKTGMRRAKQASAVLRFIDPKRWGVIDWRNAAILGFYKKNGYNADAAIAEAKKHRAQEYRKLFNIMNEEVACGYEEEYRRLISSRLPRAADVDLALWAMSLKAWPLPKRQRSNQ